MPMPTLPALVTVKSVVVALWVEEPISNKRVFVSPFRAWTESLAKGVEEPTPRRPAEVIVVVPLPPK